LDHVLVFFFFFQAEDGIRDGHVNGVQTCALPIYPRIPWTRRCTPRGELRTRGWPTWPGWPRSRTRCRRDGRRGPGRGLGREGLRSEERRVGKECRSRRSRDDDGEKRVGERVGRER